MSFEHHSRQDGRGALFEISKSTHLNHNNQDGRLALHPYNGKHPEYPKVDKLYNKDQTQYWKDRLEPPRDCRRLNFLREYDNENTKLYP